MRVFGALLFAGVVVFHVTYVRLSRLAGRAGEALAIAAVGGGLVGTLVVAPALAGSAPGVGAPLSSLAAAPLAAGAIAVTALALRVPPLRALDHAALAFLPAILVARAGCALVHDHLGRPADSPLAVAFLSGARHDLGVLEWLGLLPIALAARALRGPLLDLGARTPGRPACLVAAVYCALRALVESFGDAPPSAVQILSVVVLVASLATYAALPSRARDALRG